MSNRQLQASGPFAMVSSLCIDPKRLPIKHGTREPEYWILASCEESDEFNADVRNYKPISFERLIEIDPTLAPLREFPVETEITRLEVNEPWRFIVDGKVVDEDGNVVGKCE